MDSVGTRSYIMKKRMLSVLLAFMMSLSLLHIGAFAADMTPPSMSDYETVSISSAEELLKLVSGTDTSGETLGKIYRLGADLTIDTSALETSFWGTSRKFCGVLDGNNHTVTLESNADTALQPLFDGVVGTATTYAGVKNLTLKVTGPVAGTTLAGCISYASIDNVKIEFTTVSFAEYTSDGDYAVATGVFGHSLSGMPSYVTNVAVKGGTIGSEMAQDKQYVLAAGVYTEYNLAGGTIDCRGIKVNVENIYATTSYQATDGDAACCAAGVVSGVVQSNARVANASVNLTGNIRAIARDGSNVSQVGAYGLGHWLISMYACDVIVGGNIEAEGSDYKNSNHYNSDIDQTVAAAGLGYMVYTKYNNVLYNAADSGVCGVTVGGSIKATGCREKDDSYQYDPAAIAAGTAVWADATYPMKNITVKAETIEAHATNTCAAYANGFAYRVDIGGRAQGSDWNYDFVNCSVDVDTIFSSSVSNTSFATGFIYHGYGSPCGWSDR